VFDPYITVILSISRCSVLEEKTIDDCFFEEVTEIRSARREAVPRGKGDYISGSAPKKNHRIHSIN